jgi:hypothetical protein
VSAKQHWIAGIVLLGVFASGVLLGGFGSVILIRQFIDKPPPHADILRLREDPSVDRFSRKLARELELSSEQERKVRKELTHMGRQIRDLHSDTRQEFGVILDTGGRAIAQHLEPAQKVKFMAYIVERRRAFMREMQGPRMHGKIRKKPEEPDPED